MIPAARHLALVAIAAAFLGRVSACKQDGFSSERPPETLRKGVPVTPVKKSKSVVRRAKAVSPNSLSDPQKTELFAAQIVGLAGPHIQFRASLLDPTAQAKKGAQIFGGGFVATGENSRATLPIRNLGTAILSPVSQLYIPEYHLCGALLVTGKVTLEGPPRETKIKNCLLHTPSASILVPTGSRGIVTVSARGDTWIMSEKGPLRFVLLDNESGELEQGYEIILGIARVSTMKRPLSTDERKHKRKLEKWLVARALRKSEKSSFVNDTLLEKAEQLTTQLRKNVTRLGELKVLNRRVSQQIKEAAPDKKQDREGLRKTLTSQAREMIDLKTRSALLTHRILVFRQLSQTIAEGTTAQSDKIDGLNQQLTQLAETLPEFFTRPVRHPEPKRSGESGLPH